MSPQKRWQKIQNFKFPTDFLKILCHKQQWNMPFAIKAVEEYKKFMYLATYSPVTPSLIIDEIWHLHIQWTSLYAEFCRDIFSHDFCHHSPEFNLPSDGVSEFHDQYYETLERYYWEFNCHPPSDIWFYKLNQGVQYKLNGRTTPLTSQTLWKNIYLLFSPFVLKTLIKANKTKYQSSSLIFPENIEETKILQWKFPEGFEERLSRENEWSKAFALEAMSEYLKFHLLKLRGIEGISAVLEKVWLLHLLATKNYEKFSHTVGKKIISYNPNIAESFNQSKLISEYQNLFVNLPPDKIWLE